MIDVRPFKKEHYKAMILSPKFHHIKSWMTESNLSQLEKSPFAYSLFCNGRPVAAAGVNELWQDRGEAWAFFAECTPHEFLLAFRAVKRFLDACPIKRIEAGIKENFDEGHRWIKLLGFKLEAPSRPKYTPDGADYALYARVK